MDLDQKCVTCILSYCFPCGNLLSVISKCADVGNMKSITAVSEWEHPTFHVYNECTIIGMLLLDYYVMSFAEF